MSDAPQAPNGAPLLPGTPTPPANVQAPDPKQVDAALEASKMAEALGHQLEDQWQPGGGLFEGR